MDDGKKRCVFCNKFLPLFTTVEVCDICTVLLKEVDEDFEKYKASLDESKAGDFFEDLNESPPFSPFYEIFTEIGTLQFTNPTVVGIYDDAPAFHKQILSMFSMTIQKVYARTKIPGEKFKEKRRITIDIELPYYDLTKPEEAFLEFLKALDVGRQVPSLETRLLQKNNLIAFLSQDVRIFSEGVTLNRFFFEMRDIRLSLGNRKLFEHVTKHFHSGHSI